MLRAGDDASVGFGRAHPELAQAHGRHALVVVACEVGGRWSDEALVPQLKR